MRCLPAQCVLEFFLAGDQHGGITGAPRTQFARDFASGDVLRYLDYFEDGKATAIADIESFAGNAADFLQLSDDERRFIETKLALAEGLRRLRESQGLTQTDVARRIGSSQSRVAKMETADRSVSTDLRS